MASASARPSTCETSLLFATPTPFSRSSCFAARARVRSRSLHGLIISAGKPDSEYRQLLDQMRRELRLEKIEPWDFEYYFSTLTNDFEKRQFVPAQGWPKTRQLAANLGYDLGKLPVEMRAADLGFDGAAYPILYGKEVKILANRLSGIRFYDRLLHSTGHALHYSMMDGPSFLLRANCPEPFDEGLAEFLTLML